MLKIWSVRPAMGHVCQSGATQGYTCKPTFQRQDLLSWMHNGRVSANRSPQNIVSIRKVNNDHLVSFVNPFAYTDKPVGFER